MTQKLLPERAESLYHQPEYRHCGYIQKMLETDKLRESVTKAVEFLTRMEYKFDSVAFRGMSGALIAPSIALVMNKTMLLVRKPGEMNHSGMGAEGDAACRRYIIIDDLVSSGDTARAIQEGVFKLAPQAVCLGVLEINSLGKHQRLTRVDFFPWEPDRHKPNITKSWGDERVTKKSVAGNQVYTIDMAKVEQTLVAQTLALGKPYIDITLTPLKAEAVTG